MFSPASDEVWAYKVIGSDQNVSVIKESSGKGNKSMNISSTMEGKFYYLRHCGDKVVEVATGKHVKSFINTKLSNRCNIKLYCV